MPVKTGRDPAQFGLFATPLEAMIAPDAEVRVIAAFVDQRNLLELDFQHINTMDGLHPPARPRKGRRRVQFAGVLLQHQEKYVYCWRIGPACASEGAFSRRFTAFCRKGLREGWCFWCIL